MYSMFCTLYFLSSMEFSVCAVRYEQLCFACLLVYLFVCQSVSVCMVYMHVCVCVCVCLSVCVVYLTLFLFHPSLFVCLCHNMWCVWFVRSFARSLSPFISLTLFHSETHTHTGRERVSTKLALSGTKQPTNEPASKQTNGIQCALRSFGFSSFGQKVT